MTRRARERHHIGRESILKEQRGTATNQRHKETRLGTFKSHTWRACNFKLSRVPTSSTSPLTQERPPASHHLPSTHDQQPDFLVLVFQRLQFKCHRDALSDQVLVSHPTNGPELPEQNWAITEPQPWAVQKKKIPQGQALSRAPKHLNVTAPRPSFFVCLLYMKPGE